MQHHYNAAAWGHESILNFFDKNRMTSDDIYPSEWIFLKDRMREGISVLDIGCAKGGMANVLSEHLSNFNYVGVDINQQMINAAKQKYKHTPHEFYKIEEQDYSILNNTQYDLVLVLGILHLHETWRETIKQAWRHTKKTLILDLRVSHLPNIEDKMISYFKMNFENEHALSEYVLPYNVINISEALKVIMDECMSASKIFTYGYTHPVSRLAVCPIKNVMACVYCIEK